MLKNLKIGKRLAISYACIVVFSALIALIALSGLKAANADLKQFIEYPQAADSAIKQCRIDVNITARTIREMLINPDTSTYPTYKQSVQEGIDNIYADYDAFAKSYTAKDGLAEKFKTALDGWIAIGNEIVGEIESGNTEKATDMLLNQCTPALNELVGIAGQISETTSQMQTDALSTSQRSTSMNSLLVLGLLAAAIVFSVLVAIFTTKGIVRPVKEVEAAAQNLSKGVLNTEINYVAKDELGSMAESMRSSLETLSIYIRDIDQAMVMMANGDFNIAPSQPFVGDFVNIERSFDEFSVVMSRVLQNINATSDQVTLDSSHVAASSQTLSQGATEQASAVQELSATINEISSYVQDNASNARRVSDNAQKTGEQVVQSNRLMQDMKHAMNDISEKSAKISKIIKDIEDIAFQTNILALNAAVEAARAGAAGKGFAVVADEVRSLASKSAEAAKNTTALVEGTVEAVENGKDIADNTATAMQDVVQGTGEIAKLIEEIASASNEQATSIAQVTQGVDQISTVVQMNSATAEETAAASQQLSGQAQMMKTLVSKFKLRGNIPALPQNTQPEEYPAIQEQNTMGPIF